MMGLRDDLRRFDEIGEENRMDLEDFIKHGEMDAGDGISIPITIVNLPEFVYHRKQKGGVGQGEGAEQGDPVDAEPQEGDGEGDEAGEGSGEHGYYDMDPEEFAEEMDEEFDLDLEPKGKEVIEEIEGDFTDVAQTGPDTTLDLDHLYKEGLKRTMAMNVDEEYLREVMRVDGYGPDRTFEWARNNGLSVSKHWIDDEYGSIDEKTKYDSIEEIDRELQRNPPLDAVSDVDIRSEDEQYKYPEIEEKRRENVVVVNIRDVSGSMRGTERELVEQVFTPMDWYLQGKYENAEFVYIAHDYDAWEVERDDFFGMESGGGTKVSSAYYLTEQILEDRYPFSEWNRFVFGAGDGGNSIQDTNENLIPQIAEIDANMHGYVEVNTSDHTQLTKALMDEFDEETLVAETVNDSDDVIDAITGILGSASETEDDSR